MLSLWVPDPDMLMSDEPLDPAMLMPDIDVLEDSWAATGYVPAKMRAHKIAVPPPRTIAGRRPRSAAIGDRHVGLRESMVGAMARANTMTSGPVLGSVPEPLSTPPRKPWPVIHMSADRRPPAARKIPGRHTTRGPSPMMRDTMASTQALCVPMEEKEWPTLVRKCEYHVGVPGAIPVIALEIDVCVLLTGSTKSTAARIQYPLHTTNGVTTPPRPCAAGEEAMPVASSPESVPSVCRSLTRGHAIRARAPYMNTDPGAPVNAEAVPVKIIPRPSPKTQTLSDHTIETASAGRTVRRYSSPAPMTNWIVAKKTFHTATSGDTK